MKIQIKHIPEDIIPMNLMKAGQFGVIVGGAYDGLIVLASYKAREYILLNKYTDDLDSFGSGTVASVRLLPKGTKLEITI